jgi:hypothetical protein
MFARVKKSGKYQYLQLVENRKEQGRVKQQVIATLGRMDELNAKGRVETLIRSLSRFSERAMLIITGKSDVALEAKKIGPALIFERLWQQTGWGCGCASSKRWPRCSPRRVAFVRSIPMAKAPRTPPRYR